MKDCIESTYSKTGRKSKYAQKWHNGKMRVHHRLVYEQHYGPIPPGLVIRHKCDNPACINIDHLEIGTHQDNVNDRVKRNRGAVGTRVYGSKLTEQDVLDIRNKHAKEGTRLYLLAKEYNVTRQNISYIIKRKNWKHI